MLLSADSVDFEEKIGNLSDSCGPVYCRVTRCRLEFLGSHRSVICSIGDVFGVVVSGIKR